MSHLIIAPIILPIAMAAVLLVLERRHDSRLLRIASALGVGANLLVALGLVVRTLDGEIVAYLMGDWPGRIGIVLMADRLGSGMVATTALLAIPCLLHAMAGWDRRALHFHSLFHVQLAGLNGAFLTGDLFNLFVFFEVLLIASYGLLLSGARGPRIRAGLHYVVFNVAASTVFLIALALLYGQLGTLNMAWMAQRIAAFPPDDAALLIAAGGLLMVVFCAKAALLPLYTWLPAAYSRAPAAVAALFVIMTKVGLYAVLRVGTLLFGGQAQWFGTLTWSWLLPAGIVTVCLAALGVMGATRLRTSIAYLVLASAGMLFIAFALQTPAAIAAGLYYLPHSVFVTAALFLLADLISRVRGDTGELLLHVAPIAQKTLLGTLFLVAAVSVAGLPPLSGFIGKLSLLQAVPEGSLRWVWPAVLFSSLLTIAGLSRVGTRLFWRVDHEAVQADPPAVRWQEVWAVLLLLGYGVAMTIAAEPILAYARSTSEQLLQPESYLHAVQAAQSIIREP